MLKIRSVLAKLAEQKNTSPHIGALINAYSSTAILYTPLTFLGVVTTVWGLWGRDVIQQWLPWFDFPWLVVFMVLTVLTMMVFFYKVVIPSQYAFIVQQYYKHRNPMVADILEIKRKQNSSDERLEKIEKTMCELKDLMIKGDKD